MASCWLHVGGWALSDPAATGGGFRHAAWFYQTLSEYVAGIEAFVAAGLARSEPVLVAIPTGRLPARSKLLGGSQITVADMQELGRNPARIIPAVRAFADGHPGQRTRVLGEPVWPGRSAAELHEAARHEALINLAFADADISILCPYNAAELSPSVISDACGTHPTLADHGRVRASQGYLGPGEHPGRLDEPLLAPAGTEALAYEHDLRPVRTMVAAASQRAGLSPPLCADLVIAASEVAANTLRHTSAGGVIRIWATADEVLCQIDDTGFIADPMAGRWRPASDLPGGHGLWLVNQVCDLTEIRTSDLGTTIRLHMHLPDAPALAGRPAADAGE